MYQYIMPVYWASCYHLKKVHSLDVLLTRDILVAVVHAFATSILDNFRDARAVRDPDIYCGLRVGEAVSAKEQCEFEQ